MSHIQRTMNRFLEEISYCVENGNKNGVISLINDMKNFYMTETGMKVKKNNNQKELPVVKAIGKLEKIETNVSDKPVRHIFY